MATNVIDAALVQKMFLAGAKNLESKKEWINDLNVFPVPDGDTGTNMTLTIMSAAKEVGAIANPSMDSLSRAISSGSLRGARGNSGVILSQLFRGFTKEMAGLDVLTVEDIATACQRATETAYKAVMKPKEGTILTVAKGVAEKAAEIAMETDDVEVALLAIIEHAEAVLAKTPEMLPVLKEAGVVDSGGQGLVVVLRGMYDALTGKVTDFEITAPKAEFVAQSMQGKGAAIEDVDIEFGYCTEFIIMLEKEFNEKTEEEFKAFLSSIGDSIVCVALDDIVKVHVHTNHPGQAFEKGLEYGQLSKMKVDNMREEHNEKVVAQAEIQAAAAQNAMKKVADEKQKSSAPRKEYGFVTISAGEGLTEIFKGLGVDEVIEGGQTMNPSTEDILNAADKINADVIYVLPNNKNIILAAQQAASIVEDKKLIVIPTKTVPQGITAMINFEMSNSAEDNETIMTESLSTVATGQLTYAVRDTSIDGKEIKVDDIMGLGDKGLLAVGKEIEETLLEMLDIMMSDNEDAEIVSVYYGEDIKEDAAQQVVAKIEEKYPDVDVELQFGGQPIYYYLVSVE